MPERVYVCSRPGCPNTVVGRQGYCPACEAERRAGAPSRHATGHGSRHDAERRRWAHSVSQGRVRCARCGEVIELGDLWDLDHVDGDKSRYLGPSHRSCNRSAGASKGNRRRRLE